MSYVIAKNEGTSNTAVDHLGPFDTESEALENKAFLERLEKFKKPEESHFNYVVINRNPSKPE